MTPEKIIQNKIIAYLKKLEKEGKPIYVERRQADEYAVNLGQITLRKIHSSTTEKIKHIIFVLKWNPFDILLI